MQFSTTKCGVQCSGVVLLSYCTLYREVILFIVECRPTARYTVQYYSIVVVVYSVHYTVYNIHYTVYSIQCTVYSIQYTVFSIVVLQ